jgi:hypothetical protein
MAGLADDWEENRQACADVLCAYLRMPQPQGCRRQFVATGNKPALCG